MGGGAWQARSARSDLGLQIGEGILDVLRKAALAAVLKPRVGRYPGSALNPFTSGWTNVSGVQDGIRGAGLAIQKFTISTGPSAEHDEDTRFRLWQDTYCGRIDELKRISGDPLTGRWSFTRIGDFGMLLQG